MEYNVRVDLLSKNWFGIMAQIRLEVDEHLANNNVQPDKVDALERAFAVMNLNEEETIRIMAKLKPDEAVDYYGYLKSFNEVTWAMSPRTPTLLIEGAYIWHLRKFIIKRLLEAVS